MKIQKLLVFLGILFMPFVAGAALFNDVTLGTDTIISVGGINLNVSGSSAVVESITVNASDFSFILDSGSSLNVTSSDGRILSTNADGKYIVSDACSGSAYTLKHSSDVEGSVTITVTPTSSTCPSSTDDGTGGSSGSSRHNSGGGSMPPVTTPPIPPKITVTGPTGFTFTHSLGFGLQSDDIKMLQTRLLNEGLFSGEVTGYFGPITQKAVKLYQAKYGIDQLGIVGPATRAQLNKVFMANERSNAAATSQLTPAQISTITAQINALLQQVQILQAKLKTLGN